MKNKNLQLIQVFRGIAALLVVFYHATKNGNEILTQNLLFNFFSFGGSGVDIFFVLSGFIITYTSQTNLGHHNKLIPFIKKRFIRIFPTYWIIITGFLLAQLLFPAFYKTHFLFSTSSGLYTFFLLPEHLMVNGVSWTLSYELFFYFLFSLAFLFPNKKISFVMGLLYCLIIISVAVGGYQFNERNVWQNFILFPMNIEFFMGVSSAILVSRLSPKSGVLLITAGGLLFLLMGVLSNNNILLFSNTYNRVVLFGIPAFLLITGAVVYELHKKINIYNIFLLLGDASYSLYLLHLPLIVAFYKIYLRLDIKSNIAFHLVTFVAIIAICFISILFFKFVEKPIINQLRSKKTTR